MLRRKCFPGLGEFFLTSLLLLVIAVDGFICVMPE